MSCFSIKQATSGILCGSSSVINQTPKSASVPSCRTLHLTVLAKGFNKNQLAITNLNDRNTFFRIVTVVKCIISCNRSEEHTSELQSRGHLVCRLLLVKKKDHTPRPLQTPAVRPPSTCTSPYPALHPPPPNPTLLPYTTLFRSPAFRVAEPFT